MLHTYIFNALDDFTIFAISFTNKGGIILVYRLPGPTIITSALDKEFFALSEPFAFEGIKLIKGLYESEASGGTNLKNVRKIASTGVKRISVGHITHSAPFVNFKLEI